MPHDLQLCLVYSELGAPGLGQDEQGIVVVPMSFFLQQSQVWSVERTHLSPLFLP